MERIRGYMGDIGRWRGVKTGLWCIIRIGFIRIDQMIRLCIEPGRLILYPGYRVLNRHTIRDLYPLKSVREVRGGGIDILCIDGCMNRRNLVTGCKWYKIDCMFEAYWIWPESGEGRCGFLNRWVQYGNRWGYPDFGRRAGVVHRGGRRDGTVRVTTP